VWKTPERPGIWPYRASATFGTRAFRVPSVELQYRVAADDQAFVHALGDRVRLGPNQALDQVNRCADGYRFFVHATDLDDGVQACPLEQGQTRWGVDARINFTMCRRPLGSRCRGQAIPPLVSGYARAEIPSVQVKDMTSVTPGPGLVALIQSEKAAAWRSRRHDARLRCGD
jgi:hypothetical protein